MAKIKIVVRKKKGRNKKKQTLNDKSIKNNQRQVVNIKIGNNPKEQTPQLAPSTTIYRTPNILPPTFPQMIDNQKNDKFEKIEENINALHKQFLQHQNNIHELLRMNKPVPHFATPEKVSRFSNHSGIIPETRDDISTLTNPTYLDRTDVNYNKFLNDDVVSDNDEYSVSEGQLPEGAEFADYSVSEGQLPGDADENDDANTVELKEDDSWKTDEERVIMVKQPKKKTPAKTTTDEDKPPWNPNNVPPPTFEQPTYTDGYYPSLSTTQGKIWFNTLTPKERDLVRYVKSLKPQQRLRLDMSKYPPPPQQRNTFKQTPLPIKREKST
jgi:tellurite resistance-related uncharacterized protein